MKPIAQMANSPVDPDIRVFKSGKRRESLPMCYLRPTQTLLAPHRRSDRRVLPDNTGQRPDRLSAFQ